MVQQSERHITIGSTIVGSMYMRDAPVGANMCDVSMLNVYGYGIYMLEIMVSHPKYKFIFFINKSHLELDGVLYVKIMLFKWE